MKFIKAIIFSAVIVAALFGVSCTQDKQDTNVPDKDNYPPYVDDSVTGTLYTVIPDKDIITVSLTFSEKTSYIFEKSSDCKTNQTAEKISWILSGAQYRPAYHFYVVGKSTEHKFECCCVYKTQNLTCKEFIDGQYEMLDEYYEVCGRVSLDSIYSKVNRALQNKYSIEYDELFF